MYKLKKIRYQRKRVDAAAERARRRVLTPIFGQGFVYNMKIEQAKAYFEKGSVGVMIEREARALNQSHQTVAQRIVDANDKAVTALCEIEEIRQRAYEQMDKEDQDGDNYPVALYQIAVSAIEKLDSVSAG